MKPVKVRGIEIGKGRPKVCVPITGVSGKEVLEEARKVRESAADLAEWRADWYEERPDGGGMLPLLKELRAELGDMPLLFTFRTRKEGGEKEITPDGYERLGSEIIKSGDADLIDVELSAGEGVVSRLTQTAHSHGVKVVCSSHDFERTPPKDEIVARLVRMQELGTDIAKAAVMPQSRRDVLTLLEATEEMWTDHGDSPVITMSMGKTGIITRLCGEAFGSCVTFGTVGRASAPGQIKAEELAGFLDCLHGHIARGGCDGGDT